LTLAEAAAAVPRIHHLGRSVQDIDAYLKQSPWPCRRGPVVDALQGARLALLEAGEASPWIELIEPSGDDSTLWGATEKGVIWHHVCFEFGSGAEADEWLEENRLIPVTDWKPAVLFDNRGVRFTYSRNRELIELLAGDEPS
jgi:Glyoxalase/Bleomycin resistance protein/Dioxygenase superfamily